MDMEMDVDYLITRVNQILATPELHVVKSEHILTNAVLVQKEHLEMGCHAMVNYKFFIIMLVTMIIFKFIIIIICSVIIYLQYHHYTDVDDCDKTNVESSFNDSCFPGVECIDRKAPERGFDCGPCPKGFVGNGRTCHKEGNQAIVLMFRIRI